MFVGFRDCLGGWAGGWVWVVASARQPAAEAGKQACRQRVPGRQVGERGGYHPMLGTWGHLNSHSSRAYKDVGYVLLV